MILFQKYTSIILILFLGLIFSCTSSEKNELRNYTNYTLNHQGDSVKVVYYSKKQVNGVYIIKNNKKNGIYRLYYPNNVLKEKGLFINDTIYGVLKKYDTDGRLSKVDYVFRGIKIYSLDPTDYELKKYNFKNEFNIYTPLNWEIIENYKNAILILKKNGFENESPVSVTIVKSNLNVSSRLEEDVKKNMEIVKTQCDYFNLASVRRLRINKFEAFRVNYFAILNNKKIGVLCFFIRKNNLCYLLSCMADEDKKEYIKYEELFDEIASTFN